MRIVSFDATAVYGHLDLKVRFNNDLTFLTGINGSGKTTVVKGLSALLTPSLYNLAQMDYKKIQVSIKHGRKTIRFWASKASNEFVLGNSNVKETLSVPIFLLEPNSTDSVRGIREKELDYYRDIEVRYGNHPVLRMLNELPIPMILGIERRYTDFVPIEDEYRFYARTRYRFSSVSGNPLQLGLAQAAFVAEERYRAIQAKERNLTDKLRAQILLSAIRYEPSRRRINFQLDQVHNQDIVGKNTLVQTTLQKLGLPSTDIERELGPFFKKLAQLSEILKDEDDLEQIISGEDDEKKTAVTEWLINYSQFERINRTLSYVEKYIEESKKVNEPIERYLSIVNNFLVDSRKEIKFDEKGSLVVSIEKKTAPITSLSSGESQILVMITHLSLNTAAQTANVFIVDEPELSLHLRWQELFVKAVQEANPNLQLILATHSPAIILDDVDKCVDLSKIVL